MAWCLPRPSQFAENGGWVRVCPVPGPGAEPSNVVYMSRGLRPRKRV